MIQSAFLTAFQHQAAAVKLALDGLSKSETVINLRKASKVDAALKALNKTSLTEITSQITPQLNDLFVASSHTALVDLGVNTQDTFDVVNDAAADWADSWAADLVTGISNTTRDALRDVVTEAFENGQTPAQLADVIESNFLFSESRSNMIARTEVARAQMQGIVGGWRASGMVGGKQWVLGGDHDDDDECNDNEADGIIPLDDTFTSGDDAPPAHPNCNCGLSSVLDDE